jgi:ribosomal protein S6
LKKIQECQKHRISELESTFNASDENARSIIGKRQKNTIISKIKTEQHDATYDLMSFMANPAAQMPKKITK